jgi:hypothetical protein
LEASRALGLSRRRLAGLAAVCEQLLGLRLDKSEQCSDWQARPLSKDQVEYAAIDAAVLLPLLDALGPSTLTQGDWRQQRQRQQGAAPPHPTSPPASPSTIAAPPAVPPLSSTSTGLSSTPSSVTSSNVQLANPTSLVASHLGKSIGGRRRVLQLCARHGGGGGGGGGGAEASGEPVEPARGDGRECEEQEREVISAGGSGMTRWGCGGACLYINTANARPHAGKYRNRWWREQRGDLSGSVLLSWFPGRGQRLTDPPMRALLRKGTACLLFCRRNAQKPYTFCGRLAPIAIAATDEGHAAMAEHHAELTHLQRWRTGGEGATAAAHVVWCVEDAEALFRQGSLVDDLFGVSSGVGILRPAQYRDEI